VRAMLNRARGSDVVVKTSGIGVLDDLLETEVLGLQADGSAVGFWDVDAPATLERVFADPADPFRALVPRYDFVFTYGGGDPVVSGYRALGASRCAPIYNALDPETHFRAGADPRYACDLALLANRLPDREARIGEFFLRAARLLPEARFLLGGSGWHDAPLPENVRAIGHVPTGEHNVFNASPLAVLNVSRESMARFGFSPATRVFEAAGAGACIITDAWEGIGLFLEPGAEILVARDGSEVAEHVRALELDRARARVIGEAARHRVLAEHTYAHRAAEVEARLLSLVEATEPLC
jgi:spore maturation protein CgeB